MPSGPLAAVAAAAQAGPAFCSSSSRHGTPVAGGGTLSNKPPGGQYLEKQSAGNTCTCTILHNVMGTCIVYFFSYLKVIQYKYILGIRIAQIASRRGMT